MVKCPCCEGESTKEEWYKLAGDDYLICPACQNVCTRDEFKEDAFD